MNTIKELRLENEIVDLKGKIERLRGLLQKAIGQMECLQENLHKGMSKSIQKMQGYALMETVAELRATDQPDDGDAT